jgi:hypothetical protein
LVANDYLSYDTGENNENNTLCSTFHEKSKYEVKNSLFGM